MERGSSYRLARSQVLLPVYRVEMEVGSCMRVAVGTSLADRTPHFQWTESNDTVPFSMVLVVSRVSLGEIQGVRRVTTRTV